MKQYQLNGPERTLNLNLERFNIYVQAMDNKVKNDLIIITYQHTKEGGYCKFATR